MGLYMALLKLMKANQAAMGSQPASILNILPAGSQDTRWRWLATVPDETPQDMLQ